LQTVFSLLFALYIHGGRRGSGQLIKQTQCLPVEQMTNQCEMLVMTMMHCTAVVVSVATVSETVRRHSQRDPTMS